MLDEMNWRYRLTEARAMLAAERRLLKAGEIGGIAALDRRRRALAAEIEQAPAAIAETHGALIEEIREQAARNGRMLAAYLAGARDAAARLRAIDERKTEIGAYRRDGSRLASPAAGPTRERRA
ncbi:MAG: hypothetical protein ACK5MQ_13000 [Pikeienuella sp.]